MTATRGNGHFKVSRREFISTVGWGALLAAAGSCAAALGRFLSPNVVATIAGPVEIGTQNQYEIGSTTFIEKAHSYLIRDERGFYAIVAVCTHLGCTPRREGDPFVCPCHGSRFTREGKIINGPAPRALDHAFVGRSENGQLFVDPSRIVNADYRLPA